MKRVKINNHANPLIRLITVLAIAFAFIACSGDDGGDGGESSSSVSASSSSGGKASSSSSGKVSCGEWEQTKAPTCEAEGEKARTCSDGSTELEPVDNLSWNGWEVTTHASNCGIDGVETRTCPGGAQAPQTRPIDAATLPYDPDEELSYL